MTSEQSTISNGMKSGLANTVSGVPASNRMWGNIRRACSTTPATGSMPSQVP